VTNAVACLEAEDYEGAIENATDAMSIFREVYRAINEILCDSDAKICQSVDPEELEAAIDRSLEKIEDLKALISVDAEIYSNITAAEDLLLEAKNELLPDDIEAAKDNLREANSLIRDVCQYLKEVAQDLNPGRIRDYCEEIQYRYRFRERFGQAETEGFDVNGFLQGFGYQNEDDFNARFQEMMENAQQTDDIQDAVDDLEEIGRFARELDGSFNQHMGQFRAQHGQNNGGAGYGQQGSGSESGQYSGSQTNGGSGQMGPGSGH
jgi:tetrahydromethanopterin S-methyltransferase subunit F